MNRSLLALATSVFMAGTLGVSCADNEPDDSTPAFTGGNGGAIPGRGGDDSGTGGESSGGEGGQTVCAPTQTICDAFCASTGSDPLNCGTCENECGAGEGCLDGKCEDFGCSTGQVTCDDACTNLQADRMNCGDCGEECGSGEVCDSGLCATSCANGRSECDGGCIDPMTDRMHCGASECSDVAGGGAGGAGSGVACDDGEVCAAGSCTTSCPGEQIVCDNRCVAPSKDRDFCGATDCSAPATSGEECVSGEVCNSGVCATSCPSGQIVCDERCVDPNTDRLFCGAVDDCIGVNDGASCANGTICSAGSCETSCPSGFVICNDRCIDPGINRDYCGATDCSAPATSGDDCSNGEICAGGVCEVSCPVGQISCNDKCVDPDTDRNFCGATDCESGTGTGDGEVCGGGEYCVNAACEPSCPADYVICDDKCIDPLGNDDYCGATDCGNVMTSGDQCTTEESCVVGECRAFVFEWKSGVQVNLPGTRTDNGQAIGTDSLGNTLVIYKQYAVASSPTQDSLGLYGRRYNFATKTWTNPVQIFSNGKEVRTPPRLAVAANGNAYAVWDTRNEIYGAPYLASTNTWGTPVRLDTSTSDTDAGSATVGIDSAGNAWIAWSEQQIAGDANAYRIVRRYFDRAAGSLPAPPEIVSGYPGFVGDLPSFYPTLRMNPNGDAALVWSNFNRASPARGTVYAATKKAGQAWESPVQVSESNKMSNGYGNPFVGIDDAGNSYVVWNQFAAALANYYVRVAKYDGTSWGAPVDITDPAAVQRMRDPRIVTDAVGNSVVTFFRGDHTTLSPVGPWPVYAVRLNSSLAYDTRLVRTVPNRVVPANTQAGIDPRAVLDSLGNSHVVWNNNVDVETERYDAAIGNWSNFEVLASGTSSAAYGSVMSSAPGGRAFAAWYQGGNVQFARFD